MNLIDINKSGYKNKLMDSNDGNMDKPHQTVITYLSGTNDNFMQLLSW